MKAKLFSLVAIFAAMTLVACGTKTTSSSGSASKASSGSGATQSTSQGPKWGDWTVKTPATCGAEGVEERTNDAGEKEQRPIAKLKQHTWTATDVAASGEGVAYEDIECSVCHVRGLRVATAKATLDGTDKGYAPEGCIKLANAGESMEVKINIPAAKSGKIYLTGAMDYWHDGNNRNEEKSFSYCKNSSNTANFKLEVNAQEIDMTANLNVTFGEIFPEEVGETIANANGSDVPYSQIGDAEVGAVTLNEGLNTIKFTRIDSYNLAVKYFTVVYSQAAAA